MMQILLIWHIAHSANEWDILNGAIAKAFMILILLSKVLMGL